MSLHTLHGSRLLIIHQGAIGDFILALPAFKALRNSLNPVHVGIMAHSWNLPLVHNRVYADKVFDVDRAEIAPFFHENAPLPASACTELKDYDVAVVIGTSAVLVENLQRAGVDYVHLLPPFPAEPIHLTDHHLRSLASLGITASDTIPAVYPSCTDIESTVPYLPDADLLHRHDRRVVALHPGAGSVHKAWSPARFAALGRHFHTFGFSVILISGPADESLAYETRTLLQEVPCTLLRDLPLNRLAAILAQCTLYVGNDSGISHLAAAVGTRTIAIFGPTDYRMWAPRGTLVRVLWADVACRPCTIQERQRCLKRQCLQQIDVGDVLLAATHLGAPGFPPALAEPLGWCMPASLNDTGSEAFLGR